MADELENISAADRAKIKTAIGYVAAGGPSAEAGAARLKKLLQRPGVPRAKLCGKFSIDVASDAAKKIMLGQ